MTTRSLGFANKIIFIILFSYLYKKQSYKFHLFFLICSFALYSIALKDDFSVFNDFDN